MSDDSRDTDDSEPLDELDEEFSLDKLSKAYADVIRKRSGDSELAESGEDDSSTRENPAPTTGNKSSASPQRKKTKEMTTMVVRSNPKPLSNRSCLWGLPAANH